MKALPVRILAAAGLLAAMLVGLVLAEARAREAGREVMLTVEAFDPRSLLSGHYVDLNFVQRQPIGAPCPPQAYVSMERQWVALKPAGSIHVVAGVATNHAGAAKLGPLVVRGAAMCQSMGPLNGQDRNAVRLEIGLRRFHAPQAEAERIEKRLQARDRETVPIYAVVSIGDDGRARLKGLIVDGQRTDLDWW